MAKNGRILIYSLILVILILLVFGISWFFIQSDHSFEGFLKLAGIVIAGVSSVLYLCFAAYNYFNKINKPDKKDKPPMMSNTNTVGAQSVATGENSTAISTFIKEQNILQHINTPEAEKLHAEKSKQRYLEAIQRHCQVLNFTPLGKEADDITLDQIYIALNTTEQEPVADKGKRKEKDWIKDR